MKSQRHCQQQVSSVNWYLLRNDLGGTLIACLIDVSFSEYPEKHALRYGFQQTKPCKNFAKAFICVQKCLDLNYDVAKSDRFCNCSCLKKPSKEKFTLPPVTNGTKWKSGAPTTTIFITPTFAPTFEDEPNDDKNYDNGPVKSEGGSEESRPNQEGDSLAKGADEENSTGDGGDENGGDGSGEAGDGNGGDGSTAEDGGESETEGGESKPAE